MPGHAVWFAPGEHAVAIHVGNGVAVQLVASACVELEIAHQRSHVGAGLLGGFAAVALFKCCEFIGMLRDLGRQLHQQPPALGRGGLLPHRVPSVARGLHRSVDVAGITALDFVESLAVGGVDDGQGAAAV